MIHVDIQGDGCRYRTLVRGRTWLALGRSAVKESGMRYGRLFITLKVRGYVVEVGRV